MPTAGIRNVRGLRASEEWWNSRRMLWVDPLILISCELFSTTVRKFSSAEYLRMMHKIKHHVVHSARQNLAIVVSRYWLNHASVYQLLETAVCDADGLQKTFSYPLPQARPQNLLGVRQDTESMS